MEGQGGEGLGRVSSVDSIPMHTTVHIKSSVDGAGDGEVEGGEDVSMDDEQETSSDQVITGFSGDSMYVLLQWFLKEVKHIKKC